MLVASSWCFLLCFAFRFEFSAFLFTLTILTVYALPYLLRSSLFSTAFDDLIAACILTTSRTLDDGYSRRAVGNRPLFSLPSSVQCRADIRTVWSLTERSR